MGIVALLLVTSPVFGQTAAAPWAFGMGVNFVDLVAPQYGFSTQLRNANWEGPSAGLPIHMELGRHLSPSLNVNVSYSMVKIENMAKYGPASKFASYDLDISSPYYWGLLGQLQYSFANGYIFKEDALLDPYLSMGIGTSRLSGNDFLTTVMSTGVDARSGNIGFNGEIGYAYMADRDDYIRFKMGIKVFIGKKQQVTPPPPPEPEEQSLQQEELAEKDQPEEKDDSDDDKGINITINIGSMGGQPYVQASYPPQNNQGQWYGNPEPTTEQPPEDSPAQPKEKPLEELPDDKIFDGIKEKEVPKETGNTPGDSPEITPDPTTIAIPKGKRIHFDIDKFEIKPRSFAYLNEVARRLKENPDYRIKIEGHTDETASRKYNIELSENRAFAVQKYLIEQGVNPVQILPPKGYGEDYPAYPNDSDTNRSLNRRTEIHLFKI